MKRMLLLTALFVLAAITGAIGQRQVQSCTQPPNTTMVAWYPFDEAPGSTTTANLATQNTGVVAGAGTFTGSHVLNFLNFDGSSAYVDSPSTIMTNFGPAGFFGGGGTCNGPSGSAQGLRSTCLGNFSIDTWIRTTGPTTLMVIVDKRGGAPPSMLGYSFYVQQGFLGLQLADGLAPAPGYTNYETPVLSPSIYDGNWHHIAVTVSRLNPSRITFYHNGVCVPSGTGGCFTANPSDRTGTLVNSSQLRVGVRTADPPLTGWFQGDLDELEIYNRLLLQSEVNNIFTAGTDGKCKP